MLAVLVVEGMTIMWLTYETTDKRRVTLCPTHAAKRRKHPNRQDQYWMLVEITKRGLCEDCQRLDNGEPKRRNILRR